MNIPKTPRHHIGPKLTFKNHLKMMTIKVNKIGLLNSSVNYKIYYEEQP